MLNDGGPVLTGHIVAHVFKNKKLAAPQRLSGAFAAAECHQRVNGSVNNKSRNIDFTQAFGSWR